MKNQLNILLFSAALAVALSAQAFAAGSIDLPRTGQSVCSDATGKIITCAGTGQDGDKLAGNPWPTPRFTDNNNGTATDNLTGLIWLRNANCFANKDWASSITAAAGLATGACGLSDASKAGDWRMPNFNELRSLVDYSRGGPALTAGHPFFNTQSSTSYWCSTGGDTGIVLGVYLSTGESQNLNKYTNGFLLPVRSGQ